MLIENQIEYASFLIAIVNDDDLKCEEISDEVDMCIDDFYGNVIVPIPSKTSFVHGFINSILKTNYLLPAHRLAA